MRLQIYLIASFWYTAWVDAGQPDLNVLSNISFSEAEQKEFEGLNKTWRTAGSKTRPHV